MFEVDISEVIELEALARAELQSVPRVMKAVLDVAALEERRSHEYRNRTGNLQRSTQARIDSRSADGASVELEMGEDYASYVVRKGLSHIEEEAHMAERGIDLALEAMAGRIASK
jgi:hypothetical protein